MVSVINKKEKEAESPDGWKLLADAVRIAMSPKPTLSIVIAATKGDSMMKTTSLAQRRGAEEITLATIMNSPWLPRAKGGFAPSAAPSIRKCYAGLSQLGQVLKST